MKKVCFMAGMVEIQLTEAEVFGILRLLEKYRQNMEYFPGVGVWLEKEYATFKLRANTAEHDMMIFLHEVFNQVNKVLELNKAISNAENPPLTFKR